MTARTVEAAGEGGGDGDGLRGPPMNAPTQGVLGGIMAWQPPGTPSTEQIRMLADLAISDRLVRKADGGRRPKAIRGIPAEERFLIRQTQIENHR